MQVLYSVHTAMKSKDNFSQVIHEQSLRPSSEAFLQFSDYTEAIKMSDLPRETCQ